MVSRHFWAVSVADLALAQWYAATFDLIASARLDAPDGSQVVVLRGEHVLIELKRRERHVDRSATADGYFKVGWFVPSVDREQEHLAARGATITVPAVDQPELGVRFCIVADPEGNLIQLFQEL